jgi:hypothetical protein
MSDAAVDRILAELGALRGQLDRVETRLDRVEGLNVKVAVLERQDQHGRDQSGRLEARIGQLEAGYRALLRLEHLEQIATGTRDQVSGLVATMAAKASTAALDAEAGRITALETAAHQREGMTRAGMLVWSALTALPGLVGLAIALWAKVGH